MTLSPEQIRAQQEKILGQMKLPRARGRSAGGSNDRMNRTEAAYAEHLLARMLDKTVVWFEFQAVKFRLADRCWYTPDFVLQRPSGELEIHETKPEANIVWTPAGQQKRRAFTEDDAAVKLRLMPRLWSAFRLFVVRRVKGGWELEERGA